MSELDKFEVRKLPADIRLYPRFGVFIFLGIVLGIIGIIVMAIAAPGLWSHSVVAFLTLSGFSVVIGIGVMVSLALVLGALRRSAPAIVEVMEVRQSDADLETSASGLVEPEKDFG